MPASGTSGRTRRIGGGVLPGRDELIDGAVLAVLTMIGIVGFRPAYGGHGYLAAGAAGVALGLLLSRARWPAWLSSRPSATPAAPAAR